MPKLALWMIAAGRKREAKAKKPVRKISKRQSKRLREYAKVRREYLKEHPQCEVCLFFKDRIHRVRASEDCHHKKGRIGKLLCDKTFFLAVCRFHHDEIHERPSFALHNGFSLPRV